jgi:hypothetical protein
VLGADAADDERFLRLPVASLLLFALLLATAHRRELGDEVAHLLDFLLGFFLVGGLDLVLDLFAGRVHRLEFIRWHFSLRAVRAAGGGPAEHSPQSSGERPRVSGPRSPGTLQTSLRGQVSSAR